MGSCKPNFDSVEAQPLIMGCHELTGFRHCTRLLGLLLLIASCGIGWSRGLGINSLLIVRLIPCAGAREYGRPVAGLRLPGGGGHRQRLGLCVSFYPCFRQFYQTYGVFD